MKGRGSVIVVTLLLVLVTVSFHIMPTEDVLESKKHFSSSNDGFGPTNYTDNHTYVTVGYEGRYTQLRMPGGHDYSKPLPLKPWRETTSGNGLE